MSDDPDPTLRIYDREAGRYAEMAGDHDTPGLDEFIAALPHGARVLDLGCGPGHHAARMADAGLEVLAVDGSAEMVARAAARPGVEARQALFDDIPSLGPVDGVWASFALLHAPQADLPRHLAALHAICRPGAPLALGMKLGEGEGPDPLGRFYAYYSEAELRAALAMAGFSVEAARHGRNVGLAGTEDPWILLSARA